MEVAAVARGEEEERGKRGGKGGEDKEQEAKEADAEGYEAQEEVKKWTGQTPITPTMLLIISFTALTGLLMGYDLCVVGVVLEKIQERFQLCGSNFSCGAKSLFVAILAPGAALGSALGGILSDSLGRRFGLALSDFLLLLGSIILGVGEAYWVMLLGRVVVGLGVGTGFVVYATYTTEVAPADRRGQLVACQEVAQCFGCLVAYAMAAIFGEEAWRHLLGVAGVVAGIQILGEYWILPESPRYALLRGDETQAVASLKRIGYHDEKEIQRILQELKADCLVHAAASGRKMPSSERDIRGEERRERGRGGEEDVGGGERGRGDAAAAGAAAAQIGADAAAEAEAAALEEEAAAAASATAVARGEGGGGGEAGAGAGKRSCWSCSSADSCCCSTRGGEGSSSSTKGERSSSRCECVYVGGEEGGSSSSDSGVNGHYEPHTRPGIRRSSSSSGRRGEGSERGKGCPSWISAARSEKRKQSLNSLFPLQPRKQLYDRAADSWKKKLQQLKMHRRSLFIAIGCAVAQNFTAANSVIYFSIDIFRLAGVHNPLLPGVGVGLVKFLGVLACLALVDRAGRRLLLLVGTTGTLVCHLLMLTGFVLQGKTGVDLRAAVAEGAAAAAANAHEGVSPATWLLIVSLLVYIFFWNCSWAALMFVVASEVLPTALRGVGMGLTIMTFWLLSFVMQYSFEQLFTLISIPGTFGLLAFLNVFSLLFVLFAVPEGKGQSLEELHRRRAAASSSPPPHPLSSLPSVAASCQPHSVSRGSTSSGSSGCKNSINRRNSEKRRSSSSGSVDRGGSCFSMFLRGKKVRTSPSASSPTAAECRHHAEGGAAATRHAAAGEGNQHRLQE